MNVFIMQNSIVRPLGRDMQNVLIGFVGEHEARTFFVRTRDDLTGYTVGLVIDDVDCGAMTKAPMPDGSTMLSLTLTSDMLGNGGDKVCQLLMVKNTIVRKSSQFRAYVGASNDINSTAPDSATIIIISEKITELVHEAALDAIEEVQEVIDSIPADYSALSAQVDTNTEDIGGLKADLYADKMQMALYNAMNLVVFRPVKSTRYQGNTTNNGITYEWRDDNTCTVSGTASSMSFNNIYSDTAHFPSWLKNGETYVFKGGVNVSLEFYLYKSGSYYYGLTVKSTEKEYTIPADIDGLIMRLQVENGVTVNETVLPVCRKKNAPSNTELYEITNDLMYEFRQLRSKLRSKRLEYIQYLNGGLSSDGTIAIDGYTNRINTEIVFVPKGTCISCDAGYKFNIAVYNNYLLSRHHSEAQPASTALVNFVSMRTVPYVMQTDGYVALGIGTENNDTLWSAVDNTVVYTEYAEQCADAVHIDIPDHSYNEHIYSRDFRLRNATITAHTGDVPTPSNITSSQTPVHCVYYGGLNPYSENNEGARIFKLSCPGYWVKAYLTKTYTSNGYTVRDYIAYSDYQLDENTIFIDNPSDGTSSYAMYFVVKPNLTDHMAVLTEEQIVDITDKAGLYLGSRVDATLTNEGDYADAKVVGDILLTPVTIEDLVWTYGGLDSAGNGNNSNKRVRYKTKEGRGAFWVPQGTEISAASGYKFNVALYSEYQQEGNFTLIGYRWLRVGTYTVPKDCYIRVSVGNIADDILWTTTDGIKAFTDAGVAAQSALTITGLTPIPLNKRVENLENQLSGGIITPWESAIELKDEIPLNALDFHALFDDLVSNGKITRTLLANIGNDSRYPVYLYTLRNDMNHISTDYSRVIWDGSNELYHRPKIWLTGGIHGNERTMPFVIYSFIEKLTNNIYYLDMLNAFDWYFVPLVNPWGFSHSARDKTTGDWVGGGTYTAETKDNYDVYENTVEHHLGIRSVESGLDANRDFTTFATQEAQLIRDALISLTADGRNFAFAIDAHLSTGGDKSAINALGAFMSPGGDAPQSVKEFLFSKWMQAGAKSESIMADYCGVNNIQTVFAWDGTSDARIMRNYLQAYTDNAMCFEGGQTCVYYSGTTNWSNDVARTFCNTQYHLFLKKLTEYWM